MAYVRRHTKILKNAAEKRRVIRKRITTYDLQILEKKALQTNPELIAYYEYLNQKWIKLMAKMGFYEVEEAVQQVMFNLIVESKFQFNEERYNQISSTENQVKAIQKLIT